MFRLVKKFKKKDVSIVLVCLALISFQVWLDLKLPDYMSTITSLLQQESTQIKDILEQGVYMLLCAGGSLVSAIIVGYLASLLSSTFSRKIRRQIFDKVQSFSMEEVKGFSTSSLITRTTNDVTNVEMLISMGLQLLIKVGNGVLLLVLLF